LITPFLEKLNLVVGVNPATASLSLVWDAVGACKLAVTQFVGNDRIPQEQQ
jgi:hypothetical protein